MSIPIPSSLIDNQPAHVTIELPAQWIAREFLEWLETQALEFIDHMLAHEGVYISNTLNGETMSNDKAQMVFLREIPRA